MINPYRLHTSKTQLVTIPIPLGSQGDCQFCGANRRTPEPASYLITITINDHHLPALVACEYCAGVPDSHQFHTPSIMDGAST